jgi:V/A-type H+/Na+-transporting ATPase subunit C
VSSRIYVGTKAFAIRGTLLDDATVQKLVEAGSLDELVNRLKGTPYSEVLSGLSPPYSSRRIELALRERMAYVHHSVTQGAGRYRILQLYYLRYIAWDLKLALKAKALGRPYEETSEYLDMKAEELVGRRDLLIKVLSARDINEAVTLLSGTEFFSDVEKALSAYAARGDVRLFDIYIDHAVLSEISKEYSLNPRLYNKSPNSNGVRDIVSADVDSYNVVSTLRAKLWGLRESEVQELVVTPTKKVPGSTLSSMAASESVGEAVKMLEPQYRFNVQTAATDEETIDMVEEGFARYTKRTATLAFVWQGLSPGTILALIKLLEFEVGNLAAIAIGVESGMEPRKILSRLKL